MFNVTGAQGPCSGHRVLLSQFIFIIYFRLRCYISVSVFHVSRRRAYAFILGVMTDCDRRDIELDVNVCAGLWTRVRRVNTSSNNHLNIFLRRVTQIHTSHGLVKTCILSALNHDCCHLACGHACSICTSRFSFFFAENLRFSESLASCFFFLPRKK